MTLSNLVMRNLLSVLLVLLPFLGYSQCSVSLGDDVVNCNGMPVSITAITNGQSSIDMLKITYDASQGVTGLVGSPKVYLHSGIQIVPFGGWEYAVGNWGVDDGLGEMTSLGNDVWEITISVPDYYGYPGGTNVIGLWMVFRNADGSAEGKDNNNEDIFLETSNGNASTFGGVVGTDVPGSSGGVVWNTQETTTSITATQTGTFTVTYTDGLGCTATDEIYVQILTGNATVNLGPDTSLCGGGSLILDAGNGFTSYEWSTQESTQTIEVDTAGDYSVTVTDQNGCTGIDLIHIEVGAFPYADFSYSSVTGLIVNFTDIGTDADMIYWDFDGDGNNDASGTGGSSAQYEFPSASVFGVRMVSVNSCGSDTSYQNVLVQDVGIEELKSEIGFSLYPNPASERIAFSIADASVSVQNIHLMDLTGQEVFRYEFELNTNTYGIDLGKLTSGVYVLQVLTSKGIIDQRILKQ